MFSLMLSSMLFAGVAIAQELGSGAILRVPDENTPYCHMKFRRCVRIIYLGRIRFFDDGAVHTARFLRNVAITTRSALTRLRRSGV